MRISSFPTPTPFSYFFVGFWGTSFPSNVRNTSFIYRGGELERFEDFSSFLKVSQPNVIPSIKSWFQKRFPKAEILNFAKTVSEEMKDGSHQKIQVYPVKPIVDNNNEDDVRHFEHSRSFKKDESETESKNSIEQRWVERRIFTTTDSFPSISTSNRIVNVKSIILRPVSLTFD